MKRISRVVASLIAVVIASTFPTISAGQGFSPAAFVDPSLPGPGPIVFTPTAASGSFAPASLPTGVAVGRTSGSFSVTATGQAMYSIPIWTPPGIGSLSPSLALVYSSGGGDGHLGVGWSIGGLSTISRCSKTYGQDGFGANVVLTTADAFCMDGSKLRSFGGTTYGADGAQYQTEIADFSLVISHGTASTGPTWFEVHGKNGLIYQYGNTTDSALIASGTPPQPTLAWALNRVSDRFGNHMDFAYTNDTTNQELRIATITYTTPSPSALGVQTTPNYQVQFSYVSRTDTIPTGFIAGAQFAEPYLAQTITVSAWSGSAYAAAKTYNLTYALGAATGRSTLNTVQECSPTQCYPATTVTYQPGSTGWGTAVTGSGSAAALSTSYVVDLNGDGYDDLVIGSQYWLGSASGALQGPYSSGITGTMMVPIDFNSDGKMDLMVKNSSGNWRIYFFQSAGTAFTFTDTTTSAPPAGTGPMVLTGDVDGDGRDDVIYLVSGGSGWTAPDIIYYRLNTGSGFGPETVLKQLSTSTCTLCKKFTANPLGASNAYATSSRTRRSDFNDDGRIDFLYNQVSCVLGDSGCSGALTYHWVVMVSDATTVSYDSLGIVDTATTPVVGDFNGDGCSDVATNQNSVWVLQYGTCFRAGATNIFSSPIVTTTAAYGISPIAIDWDGDGRDDIVEPNQGTGGFFYFSRSTGTGLSASTSTGIAYNNTADAVVVADVNGDGAADIVYATGAGKVPTTLPHNGVGLKADLATSFTDGFGVNYSPSYAPITSPTIYSKGTGAVFPEVDEQRPHAVVSSHSATDGIGGTYTVAQFYKTARLNLQRRTFEGYGTRRAIDSRDSFQRYAYFAQTFPQTGMTLEETMFQSDGATRISDITNTLSTATLDATYKRYFPYVSQSVLKSYELNGALNGTLITQKTTSVTFGGPNGFTYGNPSQVTTTTVDQDPTSPWTGNTFTDVLNVMPYEVGGSSITGWCIHLRSQMSDQRTQPGGGTLTHTTSYTVNTLNECELDGQTVEPSSAADKVATSYGYTDGCGNVNTIGVTGQTVTGTAMVSRVSSVGYGTRCIAPEVVTNALGQTTQAGYRYDLGLRTSVTDPNGLVSSATYDDVGHITLLQRPDGTQSSYSNTVCSGSSCLSDPTLKYFIQQNDQDATTGHATFWYTQQYFDAFGRQRYEKPLQSNGAQITTAIGFDSRGRAITRTNPFGNGFSSYTTTAVFDDLNRMTSEYRPISSTNPTLQYTYFTYQGRTSTVKDPRLNVVTKQFDVVGELSRVTDPDGVSHTNYTYSPFGALTSISDPAGNLTTRTYDALGYLLTNSSDSDRGSWVYQYDSLGELVNVRDAKTSSPSWTQQLSYDALGRMTQRIESEGTTTWTWGVLADNDTTHKYVGRLKQLSGLGDAESSTFDAVGRLASYSMLWNGTTYAINYAYNTLGKLDTLTYPLVPGQVNRFQVKYGYTDGFLSALQNYTGNVAGTTFWQLTSGVANMDPWGHVVDETLGTTTTVRIRSAFDAVTSWIASRQVGSGGSSNNLQSLTYQWDTAGNLAQRQDLKQTLTEVFTNDSLNRLQSSTLNGSANFSAVIDPTGNITSRTEGGITYPYTYDATHKHAVATVGSGGSQTSYTYDANGSMATRNGFGLTWSSANLPTTINGPGGVSASFLYGPDRQRKQQVSTYTTDGDNGTETTTYVNGVFEIETTPAQTHYKHYIQAPGGTQIIYDLQSVSGVQTTFITADHLGSGNLLINGSGAVQVNENYSAYGYRRGSNWAGALGAGSADYAAIAATTRRGYTGAFHEVLDNVALIHMNGRVYDPTIGRFLSADPVVGVVGDSQRANAYSYVSNRPLTLTDPTGMDQVGDCGALMDDPAPSDPNADFSADPSNDNSGNDAGNSSPGSDPGDASAGDGAGGGGGGGQPNGEPSDGQGGDDSGGGGSSCGACAEEPKDKSAAPGSAGRRTGRTGRTGRTALPARSGRHTRYAVKDTLYLQAGSTQAAGTLVNDQGYGIYYSTNTNSFGFFTSSGNTGLGLQSSQGFTGGYVAGQTQSTFFGPFTNLNTSLPEDLSLSLLLDDSLDLIGAAIGWGPGAGASATKTTTNPTSLLGMLAAMAGISLPPPSSSTSCLQP